MHNLKPLLPYGTGLGILLVALWILKQFISEPIKQAGQKLGALIFRRSRSFSRRKIKKYRRAVASNYSKHALGFLRDQAVDIERFYVPLQYETGGQREDVYDKIRKEARTIVLGPAGAGKSMLLKSSIIRWTRYAERRQRVPVLIDLHRYNQQGSSLLRLIEDSLRRNGVRDPSRFLQQSLQDGKLALLLDGLDEIATERRPEATQDIKNIAEVYPDCQFVVTCRDAVYDGGLTPTFGQRVRIASFDDAAIRRLLLSWFSHGDIQTVAVRNKVAKITAELRDSPAIQRLARNPLMLTMIATLQEMDPGIGPSLRNSRADFYKEAIDHLLRRDFDLGRHDQVARYRSGHKMMALRRIAFHAQSMATGPLDGRSIPESAILRQLTTILSELNMELTHVRPMFDEIVQRSELLIGVDETNLLYEFPHLTLQEYLAAMELGDDPERLLNLYKHDPSRWRESVKLWCAGANRDSTRVISNIFEGSNSEKLLALECLAEAKQVDNVVADRIISFFLRELGAGGEHQALVVAALGAVAADPGPRGRRVLGSLTSLAYEALTDPSLSTAMFALAATRLPTAVATLGKVARVSETARAALRSMGEQAVPQMVEEASNGSLEAVDDIGAIGTPSAAIGLAGLVWNDSEVAVRSAWRIAGMVRNPDVEEELRLSHLEIAQDAPRLDWVWRPFVGASAGTLPEIMSRVAWLIYNCPDDQIPSDIGKIDVRIGLPIGSVGASRTVRHPGALRDPTVLQEMERLANDLERDLSHRVPLALKGHLATQERTRSYIQISPNVERSLPFCSNLLERYGIDRLYVRILRSLEPLVFVRVTTDLLWGHRPIVKERHWRSVNKSFSPVADLVPLFIALSPLFAIPLVGAARLTISLTHKWLWGPPNLAPATIVLSVIAAILWLATSTFSSGSRRRRRRRLARWRLIRWFAAAPTAVLIVVGFATFRGWIGLILTLSIISGSVAAVIGAGAAAAYIDPIEKIQLQRILQIDQRVARTRSSVISTWSPPRQRGERDSVHPTQVR